MADELAGIRDISWVDEDTLRLDVAARVAAASSTAALRDEEIVSKAWKALEDSERKLQELRGSLEEAERQRAERANGLRHPAPSTASATPVEQQVAQLQFRVKAAEREMDKHLAALQRTQAQVEQRKEERLREARGQAAQEAQREEQAYALEQANRNDGSHNKNCMLGRIASAASATRAGAQDAPRSPAASGAAKAHVPRPVRRGRGGGNGDTAQAAAAVPRRIPSSFPLDASRAVTLAEYSGGEVLPSLNRVQVTRTDLKARHMRYDDDTDVEKYVARQEKRRRLEMVEALQRHRLEHPEQYREGKREGGVKEEEKEEEEGSALGAAVGNGVAQGQRGESGPANIKRQRRGSDRVKREAQDGDGVDGEELDALLQFSSPTLAKAQYEMRETSMPTFEDEAVIDVDAMMEEEEDMSLVLLQDLLKKALVKREDASASDNNNNNNNNSNGDEKADDGRRKPRAAKNTGTGRKRSRAALAHEGEGEEGDMSLEEIERAYHNLHLPPEPEVTLLPGIRLAASVHDRLLDYQQEGLSWLVHLHAQRCGGILGDEMGLGKTVQVAALLNALHRCRQLRGPALIVAPMTVLQQWVAELHRWAPHLRVCVMHESSHNSTSAGNGATTHNSPAASRAALIESVRGTPAVVITTYTAMRLNCTQLHDGGFQYIILDEGHKISNPEAGITLAAKSFTTPHRLILSGSPIQNRLKELWCLFDFVKPGLLGSMHRFTEEFEEPISKSKNIRATPMALASAVECAKVLQAQIAPYLLRRLKKQVNTILPKKFERVIRVPLSDEQLELYVDLLASSPVQQLIGNTLYQPTIWGGRLDRDGRDSTGSLHVAGRRFNLAAGNQRKYHAGIRLEAFRVMNQLRQICNHADLFKVVRGEDDDYLGSGTGSGIAAQRPRGRGRGGARSATSGSGSSGGYRCFRSNNVVNINGSSKLRVLLEMVHEWKLHGHRALIFTQTRMMLDILENLVEQENYRYIRMDGATQGTHRQELMDRFNEDESIFLALLTTRVGGIGVNLVGADRVVIFDPDWNPITDVQARERAWRIGQSRDVCVYRLITSGTVEEAILRRQLSKTYVTDKVLKDPNLQRFFHQQEHLVENFFLGSEYDSRVPPGRKHVLVAQELVALPLADSAGGEQERALEEDDNTNNNPQPQRQQQVKTEVDRDADGHEGGAAPPAKGRPERQFGELLRVVSAEDDGFDTAVADEAGGEGSPTSPRGRGDPSADGGGCETELLKSLLDGQDVSISGSDSAAQRLARSLAQQKMQRVVAASQRAGASEAEDRSLAGQRREYSLLAAQAHAQAKDDADRADQRRYAEEEARNRVRRRHGW